MFRSREKEETVFGIEKQGERANRFYVYEQRERANRF